MSLRCRTSRLWPYFIITTRTFLVPRNGQTNEASYYSLHALPSVWGGIPKAPLCPIVATAPLDPLHVDFTSIETTLELNHSPRITNILVFQDHFTKHVLAYVTPDQTVKTITKFLYRGYISIFGAPARLLSDRDASFTSSVIEELCKILGVKWLWTMPYHPQMNGLVERLHQMIMCMIGKLGEGKKADWPSHLAEIAHAYNATQSTVWCSLVYGQVSYMGAGVPAPPHARLPV